MKVVMLGLVFLCSNVSAGKLKDLYIKTTENVEVTLMNKGLKVLEIKNVGFDEEASDNRCDFEMSSKVKVINPDSNIIQLRCSTCLTNGESLEAIHTNCR